MRKRTLLETILSNIRRGFITVIYGPRRVGKSVLLGQILQKFAKEKITIIDGDTREGREALSTDSEIKLRQIAENCSVLAVDEAQRIPQVGLALKIITDRFPDKKIFITGSSSLDISRGTGEPLTGRTIKFRLFPFSTKELSEGMESHKIPYLLNDQLIYGGYPYLTSLGTPSQKQEYLLSIVEDYLLKDLFELQRFEDTSVVKKLCVLLAFQIGSEVSANEISGKLGISVKTVLRYINLLQKAFVIFELGSFSRNLRTEVVRSKKYYFYDLGIRNSLINQFFSLDIRMDTGALWENFLIVERIKKHEYSRQNVPKYFWRDYFSKAEIDLIEEYQSGIKAFEFKIRHSGNYRTPKGFAEAYKIKSELVAKENYLDFIL